MANLKTVSVVVAAYNAAGTIAGVIECLLGQDYPKDKLEVIIVDDGSTDETARLVKEYPVKYIYQKNKGPAAARNLGWRSSTGEIVCFTDADCMAEKAWVSKLVSKYNSKRIAGVGGSYDIMNSKNLLACCLHEEILERHLHMPEEVNYLGAFNVSYRRSVLEEVNGFDQSFRIASGEDNELSYRIKKKGYSFIFDKNIKVSHYHPENLLKYLKRQFWHGFWRMKIYAKHPHMSKGDVYAGSLDFIRPPLALIALILIVFSFYPPAGYMFLILQGVLLVLQIPLSFKIIRRTKQKKITALIAINFLRDYARGLGMLLGVLRFFVFLKMK
ncbi:MAG: glycosyltransferase [Candidatus Omnitrophota bacterium]